MTDLTLWHRPYKFRGSDRPTGVAYCLRNPQGECVHHGTVFVDPSSRDLGRVLVRDLPSGVQGFGITVKPGQHKIGAYGTCQARDKNRTNPSKLRAI